MARQTLTKTTAPGPNPSAGVAVTMTAADTTDKEQFVWTGSEILIIHNTDSGSQTWTLTSVADPYGRVGHITSETIAAGAIRVVDCLSSLGWRQTNGFVYLEASDPAVEFGVITTAGRSS